MHEGKIKPGTLNREHILKTFNNLNEAAADGYGKGWQTNGKELPSRDALLMQRNLYKFSQAKDHAMLVELSNKLTKDGKILPFNEFKKEALKLNSTYNINYLQAEYQTANHSAKMAAFWETAVRNKKLFPNLKYKTQQDERVREKHKDLNNVIAPIESAFWKKYLPPLDFRCRCYPVQTAAEPTEKVPTIEIPKQFEMNVGETKEIFNNTGAVPHPYFQLAKRSAKGKSNLPKIMEINKLDAPYNTAYTAKNGAKVQVSMFADLQDLESNYNDAVLIADKLLESFKIRPHLNGRKIIGVSNPEFEWNGKLGDKKTPKVKSPSKLLNKGNKQGCEFVVFNFENLNDELKYIIELKRILKKTSNYPLIKELFFIYKDKSVKYFSREEFIK
ncbi:MAG: phage minor head protein [Candidatus Methylacidiphilales bacterium]